MRLGGGEAGPIRVSLFGLIFFLEVGTAALERYSKLFNKFFHIIADAGSFFVSLSDQPLRVFIELGHRDNYPRFLADAFTDGLTLVSVEMAAGSWPAFAFDLYCRRFSMHRFE